MSLAGKRVLLTGASGGIGSALAMELARAGAKLALAGRNAAKLAALVQNARARGAQSAVALPFDLAAPDGHEALVEAAAQALEGLDVLVNNAGIQRFGPLAAEDPHALAELVAINLTAPLLLTRAALARFGAHDRGHIVNIGSTFGAIAHPNFAAYSATKFALRGLSEALRRELSGTGVRVTYVSPRATDTAMNGAAVRELQAKTGAHVDDAQTVAHEVVAAISAGVAERQIGRPERFFVRLNALFPRLVDGALAKQARAATPPGRGRLPTS
ncbi:MAG TPA: SDR family oxidoreductase [Burkholderiales bacterium]|nr:SDR family oxidoreductase [Burkholderiales bacterium]